jgi:hypothetical protein
VSKKKDDEAAAGAPAPTGPEMASATLLVPLHMKTTTLDGTIAPLTNPDHKEYQLFDEGRFLQVRRKGTGIVRNIPWTHVRHWTPMGAE